VDEQSRRTALIRAATQAYEAAHGNPLPEPPSGLRWSISPRVAVTVLGALAVLVALIVFATSRAPAPLVLEPTSTANAFSGFSSDAVVTVHVVGAVNSPGLYELGLGARVGDAIEAAGGPAADADLGSINLARTLHDGEQVALVRQGESEASAATASGLLNINQADAASLEALPGIGPVLAQRIVSDRDASGPFRSVDDLDRVTGVGPAVLERVRALLTV
jgi:competence protein ComEA